MSRCRFRLSRRPGTGTPASRGALTEMRWHECRPARWRAEQDIARQLLQECKYGVDERGVAFIQGVFHVLSQHGHRYESVTLRIEYPPNFPDRGTTPKVILLSHRDRWQCDADAH